MRDLGTLIKGRATSTDTNSHSVISAPGSGFRVWVNVVTVSNSSTTDTVVQLKSGSTTIWSIPAPQKGGATLLFDDTPITGADNEAINITADDAATTITVCVSGFIARTNPT